ncbi:ABC transporter permease [bacterium]|nr:ABC transporter permease [bacterium]MCP5462349.1 ABC transporter permease [bacterium]
MKTIFLMIARELKKYFFSITGYVIVSLFLVMYGYNFWFLATVFSDAQNSFSETFATFYFGTFFYWVATLMIPPVLTMQSIAEERKQGTLQLLLTAPLSCGKIVFAKYCAALAFYIIMWAFTALHFIFLVHSEVFSLPIIISGYFGTLLFGSVFLSMGIFASAISKNLLIAAIVSIAIVLFFFSIGFLSYVTLDERLKSVFDYVNIVEQTYQYAQGVIDSRTIVYCISLTCMFLYLSSKSLAAEQWR